MIGKDVMVVELERNSRIIRTNLYLSTPTEAMDYPYYAPGGVFRGAVLAPMQVSAAPMRQVIESEGISWGPLRGRRDSILLMNVNTPPVGPTNPTGFSSYIRSPPPHKY